LKTLEQAAGFHDQVVEIENPGLKQLPATEGEKLAGEGSGAVGDFVDFARSCRARVPKASADRAPGLYFL
jgi:hypothetical protein